MNTQFLLFFILSFFCYFKTVSAAPATSTWATNYQKMMITQEGNQALATYYDKGNGRLTGAFENSGAGLLLKGWWHEGGSKNCGPDSAWTGTFSFLFAADGRSFIGDWGGCEAVLDVQNKSWNGTATEETISTFISDLSNENRLLDWAETNYPDLFSPMGMTKTDIAGWVYRTYSSTGTAAGIQNGRDVYVTGGVFSEFGTLVYIDTLTALLAEVDSKNEDGALSFSRSVKQRSNTGIEEPQADFYFQPGQVIQFVWKEGEYITVNGANIEFSGEGRTTWVFANQGASSLQQLIINKDISGETSTVGDISLIIVDNTIPTSSIFVTYTFE